MTPAEILNAPRAIQLPQRSQIDVLIDLAWRYRAVATTPESYARWDQEYKRLVLERGLA